MAVFCFALYFLSNGKHPVSLFNCSCDSEMPMLVADERIDDVSRFDFVAANNFKDGTGDGVVSKRVMPSSNTCVLMSSVSGSSLNIG